MKVKEEKEKTGLKRNIQKTNIMASGFQWPKLEQHEEEKKRITLLFFYYYC